MHTIVMRSLRWIQREAKLRGDVSLLPWLLFCYPGLGLGLSSPPVPPQAVKLQGGQSTWEADRGSRERNTLPWEQVIMRVRLGRINQLAHPAQAY